MGYQEGKGKTLELKHLSSWGLCHKLPLPCRQDLLQNSPNSMSGVSNNPQGIVVPASALQQGNIAMTTVNSQVVSGWCRVLGIVGSVLGEEGVPLGKFWDEEVSSAKGGTSSLVS